MRHLAAILALAFAAGGCLQGEQLTLVNPDGSGKIGLRLALKKSMLKMMEEFAKQAGAEATGSPFDEYSDPNKLRANSEGIVAWTEARRVEDGEWVRIEVVGYFEDINQVKIYEADEKEGRRLSFSCRYDKKGDGGVLVIPNRTAERMQEATGKVARGGESEEAKKAMLDMMKPMLQDLKGVIGIIAPGPIQDSRGFMETRDRSARTEFDGRQIFAYLADPDGEDAKKIKAVSEARECRVSWTRSSVTPQDLEKFRKEMQEVREQWNRRTGGAAPSSAPAKPAEKKFGEDAPKLSDEEVDRSFIRARLRLAREHVEKGRPEKARPILQSLIKDYPNHPDIKEAKTLLEGLK